MKEWMKGSKRSGAKFQRNKLNTKQFTRKTLIRPLLTSGLPPHSSPASFYTCASCMLYRLGLDLVNVSLALYPNFQNTVLILMHEEKKRAWPEPKVKKPCA